MAIRNFIKAAACVLAVTTLWLPQAATAQQLTKVTFRTDFKVNGYVGVFALAQDSGFYREQGLDVEIGQGQGSAITIQTVAAGGDTFGLADSTALVIGVSSKDIPVKALAAYSQKDIQGFAFHPDAGWDRKIASMRGKVIISSAGSAELSTLPAIFAQAGMTMKDVDIQYTDFNAKIPLFIQTKGSFIGGYATGDILRIRSKMPNVGFASFSDYGIVSYGTSLIAKTSTIESNPEMVRKFVAASNKGWIATVQDIEPAVKATLKIFPDVDPQLVRDGLKIMIAQQLHTPATAGKPIGWMADSDWQAMLDLLQKYSNIKPKATSAYYTNAFIPNP